MEDDVCLGTETQLLNEPINEVPDGNNSTAFTYVVEPLYQVITWQAIIRDSDDTAEYSFSSWCSSE